MPIIYAEITGKPAISVTSDAFVDIPGLKLDLPAKGNIEHALVTLNVPMPYAKGADFPGATFAITVDDIVVAAGGFTYESQKPASFGRVPFTLVKHVQLNVGRPAHVRAQWTSVRGSTMCIDSYASLTAVTA